MDSDPSRKGSTTPNSREYQSHLQRSRTIWDWWSSHYTLSESDFEPMRETALDHLALSPGDRVLEIGCGPGVNFERIVTDIGAAGELIAVDASSKMLEKAQRRIRENEWNNVELIHADAARLPTTIEFDAAVATLSLSVMPDIARTLREIYTSLSNDNALVVFDIRPIPHGPLRVCNPLLRPLLHWIANWNREETVPDQLINVFDEVDFVETYLGGVTFTAIARKQRSEQ